jgi:hypothetical protein
MDLAVTSDQETVGPASVVDAVGASEVAMEADRVDLVVTEVEEVEALAADHNDTDLLMTTDNRSRTLSRSPYITSRFTQLRASLQPLSTLVQKLATAFDFQHLSSTYHLCIEGV